MLSRLQGGRYGFRLAVVDRWLFFRGGCKDRFDCTFLQEVFFTRIKIPELNLVGSFEIVPSVPNEANTSKSIIAKLVSCFPSFFGGFDNLKQIFLHAVVFLHRIK